MPRITRLGELSYGLWRAIIALYRENPTRHLYLVYDLLYELDRIDACFSIETGDVTGYVFAWIGPRGNVAIHVWGEPRGLESCLEAFLQKWGGRVFIAQVHTPKWLEPLKRAVEEVGLRYRVVNYLDMVVDEDGFRPVNPELATRLRAEEHLEVFRRAMERIGRGLSGEELLRALRRMRYYGILINGELVSFAARCAAMPDVWAICDVYTDPRYRGRGFAKAVTSAITRDAVASGALAMLHVEEGNEPAIRVYRALGYRAVGARPWLRIGGSAKQPQ